MRGARRNRYFLLSVTKRKKKQRRNFNPTVICVIESRKRTHYSEACVRDTKGYLEYQRNQPVYPLVPHTHTRVCSTRTAQVRRKRIQARISPVVKKSAANLGIGNPVGTEKVLARERRKRIAEGAGKPGYTGLTDFVVAVNENKQTNKLFQYHHLVARRR